MASALNSFGTKSAIIPYFDNASAVDEPIAAILAFDRERLSKFLIPNLLKKELTPFSLVNIMKSYSLILLIAESTAL